MSHDFEILTDSTCDLSLDELAEMDVRMVPLQVFVGGESYRDQIELTAEQFYDKMAAASELPHTSQPSPSDFLRAYEEMAADGARRVLSVHLASTLSGTANSAAVAAKDATADVRVWETRTATAAHGMLVKEAVRMRDAGETLEATLVHLEDLRRQQWLTVTLGTLENLVKNGRCSRLQGFMGSLLNLKIVVAIEQDGTIAPVGKGRGERGARAALVRQVLERFGEGAHLTAAQLSTRNPEGCEAELAALREIGLTVDVVASYSAGPVIATHTGVGIAGFAFVPTGALYQTPRI